MPFANQNSNNGVSGVKNYTNSSTRSKADAASVIARGWLARGDVNVIADVPFSSAGLAVNEAVRNAPRTIYLASGTGTSDLTGPACSPNTVH